MKQSSNSKTLLEIGEKDDVIIVIYLVRKNSLGGKETKFESNNFRENEKQRYQLENDDDDQGLPRSDTQNGWYERQVKEAKQGVNISQEQISQYLVYNFRKNYVYQKSKFDSRYFVEFNQKKQDSEIFEQNQNI
ncbi:unnamed protein product [Paramecium octaurelia]|uniref:Uncharacterized protein n=1 Tax=Paramecium octaurelia TaxID=43137 RepID=A0A8S1X0Z6_PAROT|nr:unnamed protein product [Paramecium octaurelia]